MLIDSRRYERLESESQTTGRSVGSIVRAAIDHHFEVAEAAHAASAAAQRVLRSTTDTDGIEPDWVGSKAVIVADLDPAPAHDAAAGDRG